MILLIYIIMLGISYIILKITTCDYGIDYETIKSMNELHI